MNETRHGAGWMFAAQLLFGVLLYVVFFVYPRSRSIALALGLLIILGMVYCGWRGFRLLWKK